MTQPAWYWSFREDTTQLEEMVLKRLTRTGRLFAFLRKVRRQLFDEAFQQELMAMYSDAPRGVVPKAPALLAMVTLLQAYERKSDAAAVEQAVFDRRWQMVLDCLGAEEPPFSQGVLVDFRRRLVAHDMDRRLLDRTVELAKESGLFGHKALKVALDSSPLWGAGRVEDTFNLIGHALEVVVDCAAAVLDLEPEAVQREAKLELLGGSSLKAALDIDWDDSSAKVAALQRLLADVDRMRGWLNRRLKDAQKQPPLKEALELLERIITQDLEPDPGGGMRIREGVAKDRRISVQDPDMRHGRKSKSRVINGYKRHVAKALGSPFILAGCARSANEPEHEAAAVLRPDIEGHGAVAALHIDRGYLASDWVKEMHSSGKPVLCKPWPVRNGVLYPKTAFAIDLPKLLVTCPAKKSAPIESGKAQFKAKDCDVCPLRASCTRAKAGRGRSIAIHEQEALLIGLRALKASSTGRQQLRERVEIEHALAHVGRRQGARARYIGERMNTFDVRRCAAIENLHAIDRLQRAA
jgi:hypothetical protein